MIRKLAMALLGSAMVFAAPARGAVLDIDTFSAPTLQTWTLAGPGQIVNNPLVNTAPPTALAAASSINPDNGVTTVSYGQGGISLVSPTNGLAYLVYANYAYARPPAPQSFDTTPYNYYRLTFDHATQPLNINFEMYSGSPTGPALYYISSGVNYVPPAGGGPFSVYVPITGGPGFNRADVNGFLFEIDVSGNSRGADWKITDFALTSAVPEAGAWVLMIVGLGFAGAALRAERRNAARTAW